jgi:HEAT repeat protein
MADDLSKKLLRLLDDGQPEDVRAAALTVVAEVGLKDADASKRIVGLIRDPQQPIRLKAIQAIGKLRIESGLNELLGWVQEGGPEAEQSAQAAAKLGAKGTKSLQDLMPKVAPGLRRYIAAALGSGGTASADTAALHVLLDSDPGVVDAAVRSLIAQIPSFAPAKRQAVTEQLLDLLKGGDLPAPSALAAMRMLAALGDPKAETVFWERVQAKYSADMRAIALQTLGKWIKSPSKDQAKRLFACASERDFKVAAPALMILQNLPVQSKSLEDWYGLLKAPDVAVRRLALAKLKEQDNAELAELLLPDLKHPDRAYRDEVLQQLSTMEAGRKAVIDALLEAENADSAWTLARAAAPRIKELPKPMRQKIFAAVCGFLEEDDRRSDPLLFLLRETDAADLRERLEEKATGYRQKKKYEQAMLYLRLLGRDPAIGFADRFDLAAVGLKLSAKDLSHESRYADSCLGHFSHLARHFEPELVKQLEKTKWLEPEDLYYLGFHFAEKDGAEKKVAAPILQMVMKRSPKSKTGQAAKTKLKSAGLA